MMHVCCVAPPLRPAVPLLPAAALSVPGPSGPARRPPACPDLAPALPCCVCEPPVRAAAPAPKRRKLGSDAVFGIRVGTDELDRLWNLAEDNLSGG